MEVFQHTVAGLLNKQAADELGVAENTYQVHRGRVMRKMKAGSLAELVRMSTKLDPILRRPYEEDSSKHYLSNELASVEPVHGRVFTLPLTIKKQTMAARAY